VDAGRVGLDACRTQMLQFLHPLTFEIVQFHWISPSVVGAFIFKKQAHTAGMGLPAL
jgi:hypothetical protein